MASKKSNLKILSLLVAGIAAVMMMVFCSGVLKNARQEHAPLKISGVFLPSARHSYQPFQFTATDNRPFTEDNLKGHWTMMFFGFTNCGMVCPTTMAALKGMYRQLQESLPDRELPQVVMITVDPERDNLSRLSDYVHSFNPRFLGARAEIAETVALEHDLHIAAAKIQTDGPGKNRYTIDHSSEILLFNPEGGLQAYLSWPHDAREMARDYRMILRATAAT
jgi:protein SCO1/2